MDAFRNPATAAAQDLSALAWVQEELRKTLESAHKALRRYLREAEATGFSDIDDVEPSILRHARQQLHAGVGALELVNLPEGALLMRASEALVARFVAKPQRVEVAGVETVEAASFALLDYLSRCIAGKSADPVGLFPQLRALQEAVSAERIHPADLWPHDWRWRQIPQVVRIDPLAADARTQAEFERLLLGWVKQNRPELARALRNICAGLAQRPATAEEVTLWRLAAGFFDAITAGGLEPDNYVKRTASRVMQHLRAQVKAPGESSAAERLAQDLLFFCACVPATPGRAAFLSAVRDAFELGAAAPQDYRQVHYGRYDPAWIAQARKRVESAKQAWSGVAGDEPHRITQLVENFTLVGDSVRRLYSRGERLAGALIAAAEQTARRGRLDHAELAMEVATSLLYLDASLEERDFDQPGQDAQIERLAERLDQVCRGQKADPLEAWIEQLYRRVSDRQTMSSVVQELRASLSEVERQIDQFFRSPRESSLLVPVPVQLKGMRGVLGLLGIEQAGLAIDRMLDDVDNLVQDQLDSMSPQALPAFHRLAGNLGALGFLIDTLAVQPGMASNLFVFDQVSGILSPLMGRQVMAPQLVERAQAIAAAVRHEAMPLYTLQAELDALARTPQISAQPALAASLSSAQDAIGAAGAAGAGHNTEEAVRAHVARVMDDFVATATNPVGLDPMGTPLISRPMDLSPGPVEPTGLEGDSEMRAVFIEESREVLGEAQIALAELGRTPGDVAQITTVRRAFHTLKGSARMVGLPHVAEAAWAFEQLYNRWLADQTPASHELRLITGDALQYLAAWVDAIVEHDDSAFLPDPLVAAADTLRLAGELMRVQAPVRSSRAGALSLPEPGYPRPTALDQAAAAPLDEADGATTVDFEVPDEAQATGVFEQLQATQPVELGQPEHPVWDRTNPVDLRLVGVGAGPGTDDDGVDLLLDLDGGAPLSQPLSLDFGLQHPTPVAVDPPDSATIEPPMPAAWTADDDLAVLSDLMPDPGPEVGIAADADAPRRQAGDELPRDEGVDLPVSLPADIDLNAEVTELDAGGLDLDVADLSGPTDLPATTLVEASASPHVEPADEVLANEVVVAARSDLDAWEDVAAAALPVELGPQEARDDALPVGETVDGGTATSLASLEARMGSIGPDDAPTDTPAVDAPPAPVEADLAVPEPAQDEYRHIGHLRLKIPLFNIYLNEADELSRRLGTELAEWALELDRPVGDTAIALAHSLAGCSGTVGFEALSQLARSLEHALQRSEELGSGSAEDAALFTGAADEIRHLLHQFAAGFLHEAPAALTHGLSDWQQAADQRLLDRLAAGSGLDSTLGPTTFSPSTLDAAALRSFDPAEVPEVVGDTGWQALSAEASALALAQGDADGSLRRREPAADQPAEADDSLSATGTEPSPGVEAPVSTPASLAGDLPGPEAALPPLEAPVLPDLDLGASTWAAAPAEPSPIGLDLPPLSASQFGGELSLAANDPGPTSLPSLDLDLDGPVPGPVSTPASGAPPRVVTLADLALPVPEVVLPLSDDEAAAHFAQLGAGSTALPGEVGTPVPDLPLDLATTLPPVARTLDDAGPTELHFPTIPGQDIELVVDGSRRAPPPAPSMPALELSLDLDLPGADDLERTQALDVRPSPGAEPITGFGDVADIPLELDGQQLAADLSADADDAPVPGEADLDIDLFTASPGERAASALEEAPYSEPLTQLSGLQGEATREVAASDLQVLALSTPSPEAERDGEPGIDLILEPVAPLPAPGPVAPSLSSADLGDSLEAVDQDLFPVFEEEALDLLPVLTQQLATWRRTPGDTTAGTGCMRSLHTFKGGARLAGAMKLGELAHAMETTVERLLGAEQVETAALDALQPDVDRLVAAFEALRSRFNAPRNTSLSAFGGLATNFSSGLSSHAPPLAGETRTAPLPTRVTPMPFADSGSGARIVVEPLVPSMPMPLDMEESTAEASLVVEPAVAVAWRASQLGTSEAAKAAVPAPRPEPLPIDWSSLLSPPAQVHAQTTGPNVSTLPVRVRPQLLDRLVNLAGEVSITRSRLESEVGQIRGSLLDLGDNLERLHQQLRDVTLQAETQLESRMEAARAMSQAFDPLELDRYTRLQELTRMMAESVNDVATVRSTLQRTLQTTEDELAMQGRLTRELQGDLLRTRMLEFDSLSERLQRVVRQAAAETGRQARLDIVGGMIEVDRGVLDRMTPAFEHLLRNCVGHGIEPPEQRSAAGKDVVGRIGVHVQQEGNEVSVEIRDDGAGLDLGRIRDKAVAMGLLRGDVQPDDASLAQLIFTPGLSTADQVTELAGRGVGMDVVRSDVQALGGRIEIQTQAGAGTHFKLVLPLTTVVTQVVLLRAGAVTIAVPSHLVELVQRASAASLQQAYASGNYLFGAHNVPFYWLGALLESSGSGSIGGRTRPVVIVKSAQQRVAIHVDEVQGNQEVVVKHLGAQLSRLPGLAGLTLLASGGVALIYNPVALATVYGDLAQDHTRIALSGTADGAAGQLVPSAPELAPPAPLVLVVDDSLTVRRVTKRLLDREGLRVVLAKDGLEALEVLGGERPSVVLSDIEMPRMDGFDLLRNIRADAQLGSLPVIMITSRIAQKHRDHAMQLGANHYLGKPYAEEELMALVRRYAKPRKASQPA